MSDGSVALVVGKPTSEYVRVEFLRRAFPDAIAYRDMNWVSVRVEVRVGAFDGRVDGELFVTEVLRFRDELRHLYSALRGEAVLETMEGWLSLHLVGDGLGHVEVRGLLEDTPGTGNRLRFSIKLDQTELPPALDSLEEVCRAFPPVGKS
jgi:hypothetical protein